jgi:hypothetical protein
MKKLSLSLLAVLAIIFAVSSAFTTTSTNKNGTFRFDPSHVDISYTTSVPDDYEYLGEADFIGSDIAATVTTICDGEPAVLCAARLDNSTPVQFEQVWFDTDND